MVVPAMVMVVVRMRRFMWWWIAVCRWWRRISARRRIATGRAFVAVGVLIFIVIFTPVSASFIVNVAIGRYPSRHRSAAAIQLIGPLCAQPPQFFLLLVAEIKTC